MIQRPGDLNIDDVGMGGIRHKAFGVSLQREGPPVSGSSWCRIEGQPAQNNWKPAAGETGVF